jgi:hypothetical protein
MASTQALEQLADTSTTLDPVPAARGFHNERRRDNLKARSLSMLVTGTTPRPRPARPGAHSTHTRKSVPLPSVRFRPVAGEAYVDGCELCVAVAADCKCVREGGPRRSREVDGGENVRGSGHGLLLQVDRRRGAYPLRPLRAEMARSRTARNRVASTSCVRPAHTVEARRAPSASERERPEYPWM